jgi:hypothetical protein
MGGHLTEPYEQNTQQSPALGRSNARQPGHSWKITQAFVGIILSVANPQCGHVKTDSRIGEASIAWPRDFTITQSQAPSRVNNMSRSLVHALRRAMSG